MRMRSYWGILNFLYATSICLFAMFSVFLVDLRISICCFTLTLTTILIFRPLLYDTILLFTTVARYIKLMFLTCNFNICPCSFRKWGQYNSHNRYIMHANALWQESYKSWMFLIWSIEELQKGQILFTISLFYIPVLYFLTSFTVKADVRDCALPWHSLLSDDVTIVQQKKQNAPNSLGGAEFCI
jgi:hypothetical protein